jgi:hypothetical protein
MDRLTTPAFRTEIEFTLPKGYLDGAGILHRRGTMRLATAADEILPLRDPRVQANPAYLTIIILARVVVKLGSLAAVDTQVIEGLFAADLEYLRRLYEEVNASEEPDGLADASTPNAGALHVNGGGNGGFPVLGEG